MLLEPSKEGLDVNGKLLAFNVEDVSLLDINALIDKGQRFTLVTDDYDGEITKVEEYLNADN